MSASSAKQGINTVITQLIIKGFSTAVCCYSIHHVPSTSLVGSLHKKELCGTCKLSDLSYVATSYEVHVNVPR